MLAPGDRMPDRRAGARQALEIGIEAIAADPEAGAPELPGGEDDDHAERQPHGEPRRYAGGARGDGTLLDDLIEDDDDDEGEAEAIGALAAAATECKGHRQERQHGNGEN